MYQALERGFKRQTRRPLTAGNSRLPRGKFEHLDFSSGRPDGLWPVSSLRCRIRTPSGERRSVTVQPSVQPNVALWARRGQKGAGAKRDNAKFLLWVREVAAVRLQDITDADALLEGILIFAPPGSRDMLAAAYDFQLGTLGKTRLAKWRRGAVHQEAVARGNPSARDCFALLWESINGPGTWAANPWVWRYRFDMAAAAPAVTTDRLEPAGAGGAA
jgi:hypothetical protein